MNQWDPISFAGRPPLPNGLSANLGPNGFPLANDGTPVGKSMWDEGATPLWDAEQQEAYAFRSGQRPPGGGGAGQAGGGMGIPPGGNGATARLGMPTGGAAGGAGILRPGVGGSRAPVGRPPNPRAKALQDMLGQMPQYGAQQQF